MPKIEMLFFERIMPSSIRFVTIWTALIFAFNPPLSNEGPVNAREWGRRLLAQLQSTILFHPGGPPPASAGRLINRPSASETRRYEDSRVSMACVYTIVAYGADTAPIQQAMNAALDEVDRIDRLMSNYKKESELSRVNREAAKAPVKIDAELFDFLAECLRYGRESNGAFDITVGPLMKAWGFFRGEGRMPSDAELAEARNHIGYQHVLLNQKDGTIFFDIPGIELDLGGIAKGYAVDRAVAVLKRYAVTAALVSAGGSTIYGVGAPPGKTAWEVEVQDPMDRNKTALGVQLKDQALSVSGSYEKFFELGGVRYSHIMDPRTGRPVQGMLSVAVITGDGTSGDALDNVFYVLGVRQSAARLRKFSAREVIFFLSQPDPQSGKRWKMVRMRR
jgi:thiamine biosynthesis lipoprotein